MGEEIKVEELRLTESENIDSDLIIKIRDRILSGSEDELFDLMNEEGNFFTLWKDFHDDIYFISNGNHRGIALYLARIHLLEEKFFTLLNDKVRFGHYLFEDLNKKIFEKFDVKNIKEYANKFLEDYL